MNSCIYYIIIKIKGVDSMMNIKNIELKSRDIDDIRIFVNELVDYYNTVEGTNIPFVNFEISINKRLTRTLARFGFQILNNDSIRPKYLQFSNIIMFESDELLVETIKHEVAHYIVTMRYQKNCEHNHQWKEVCRILGMENISPYTKTTNKFAHKYLIICEDCGILATRDRLTKDMKQNIIDGYISCKRCGNHILQIYDTTKKEFILGGTEKAKAFVQQ